MQSPDPRGLKGFLRERAALLQCCWQPDCSSQTSWNLSDVNICRVSLWPCQCCCVHFALLCCWMFRWPNVLRSGFWFNYSAWVFTGGKWHRLLGLTSHWWELRGRGRPVGAQGDLQLQRQQHLWNSGQGGFCPQNKQQNLLKHFAELLILLSSLESFCGSDLSSGLLGFFITGGHLWSSVQSTAKISHLQGQIGKSSWWSCEELVL